MLGLQLVEPTGLYHHNDDYMQVMRAIGRPTAGDRRQRQRWLAGRSHVPPLQRDVEVVILQDAHTSGSGENQTTIVHTHVLARIDPPLFCGLDLQLERGWEPFGRAASVNTGDPQFDNAFRLQATVQGQAVRLFQRHSPPPNDVVDHMLAIARLGHVNVCDSYVNVQMNEQLTPYKLAPAVAASTALAGLIAARRMALPHDLEEQQRLDIWREFAESEQLQFDPQHFVIASVLPNGSRLRIAVETEHTKFYTLLTLEPPTPLGLGLSISEQGSLRWVADLFGVQDIRIGDDVFDKAFVIKGTNEPVVRAFLGANPAARQALVELVKWCPSLELGDNGLFVRHLQMADGQTLYRLVQLARAVATLFTPPAGPAYAYR